MSIIFGLFALAAGTCLLVAVLSYAIAWYESASADPDLVAERFAPRRLWLAARLVGQETFFLLLTVLVHPLGWLPPGKPVYDPAGGPAVILLHGLFHNRACWWWVRLRLRRRGWRNQYSINLPPWKDIESLTERVALQVNELRLAGAAGKVILVGHSMGGIIARNYLQLRGGGDNVRSCVLLAVPNAGSKLAPFAVSRLGESLVPGSPFLQRLKAAPLPPAGTLTAIFSRHDNMVLPWRSARLEGAHNIELAGTGHVGVLYRGVPLATLARSLSDTENSDADPADQKP